MEGVSFAGAEHSTPVSLKPPTDLSTPTPKRRQSRKTVPSSTTKKVEAGKKGTPVVKKADVASARVGNGRPVKSLPGKRKGKSVGSAAGSAMVQFLDAANKLLREMGSDQFPGDLENLKLLLNEALDLRYTQEIQLEHERTPGIYIPVLDAIDYRGLLERLASATEQQNIRAVVYSKLEGVPVTPVRKLYTPTRPALALPSLSTPARLSSTPELSTPQAAVATPTSALPSASKNVKNSTPKSVRIELPAPASEIRKPSVPKKSSLSISVTAEDVSVVSPPVEDVVAPIAVPTSSSAEQEKSSATKDKKRKRETSQEQETNPTVETAAPIKEKAPKKRKVAKDTAVPVTSEQNETTPATPEESAEEKKNGARRERRRQKMEEARKAAKFAAEKQQNVKLAQTLVPAPAPIVADTATASESDAGGEKSLSKREKRKQAGKLGRERSFTGTPDVGEGEDVQMDDSAREDVAEEDTTFAPAQEKALDAMSDNVAPTQVVVEPAVQSTETVDEPVEADQAVPETQSRRKAKRKKGDKRADADVTMDQSAEGSKATFTESPSEKASPVAQLETIAVAYEQTLPVAASSAQNVSPLPAAGSASQNEESKPNRRKSRKSMAEAASKISTPTVEETRAVNAVSETLAGNESIIAAGDITVAPLTDKSAADLSVTTAPGDTPSSAKTSSRKGKRSSAAEALAEWRAKQSSGTVVASSQRTQPSQVTPSPVLAQTTLTSVETTQRDPSPVIEETQPETTAVEQPIMENVAADEPVVDEDEQSDEDSETAGTPPASSAQISLPPASQKIARLPSSSPESYPSDSEESQDAWQKAHKRMRTPGSEDLEPEGDDDDEEEEQGHRTGREDVDMVEDIEEPAKVSDTPEAIASFGVPDSQGLHMEVDPVEETETPSESTPRPASPTPQPVSAPVVEEDVTEPSAEAAQPEAETKEATPRPGTPNLFTSTQDPLIPATQNHRPTRLTLTDLAAPPSPQMPSTGVVAFQDAMEEDAVADQVAMDGVSSVDDTSARAIAATQEASDVTQSGTDSGTSQSVSQSQTSTASPRRLRSRMRMRDGSKPESDPVKPLPLLTATPKKRAGRPPKAQTQPDPVVQVSTTTVPATQPTPVESAANGSNDVEADSPAPTMSRKERRVAASQSRIPALSSLSADALRKGRASRFSTSNGALPMNGTMSQPNRVLALNTQSAATSDTDEEENQETDSGTDSEDEPKDVASSLPVGLANRVAGAAPAKKSRQSLGAMKGW